MKVGIRPITSVTASVITVVHLIVRFQSMRGFSSAIIVAADIISVSM